MRNTAASSRTVRLVRSEVHAMTTRSRSDADRGALAIAGADSSGVDP